MANSKEPTVLMNKDDVAYHLRTSEKTVERMVAAGEFPEPMRFRGMVRWSRDQVLNWVAADCKPVAAGGEVLRDAVD